RGARGMDAAGDQREREHAGDDAPCVPARASGRSGCDSRGDHGWPPPGSGGSSRKSRLQSMNATIQSTGVIARSTWNEHRPKLKTFFQPSAVWSSASDARAGATWSAAASAITTSAARYPAAPGPPRILRVSMRHPLWSERGRVAKHLQGTYPRGRMPRNLRHATDREPRRRPGCEGDGTDPGMRTLRGARCRGTAVSDGLECCSAETRLSRIPLTT